MCEVVECSREDFRDCILHAAEVNGVLLGVFKWETQDESGTKCLKDLLDALGHFVGIHLMKLDHQFLVQFLALVSRFDA